MTADVYCGCARARNPGDKQHTHCDSPKVLRCRHREGYVNRTRSRSVVSCSCLLLYLFCICFKSYSEFLLLKWKEKNWMSWDVLKPVRGRAIKQQTNKQTNNKHTITILHSFSRSARCGPDKQNQTTDKLKWDRCEFKRRALHEAHIQRSTDGSFFFSDPTSPRKRNYTNYDGEHCIGHK